jgi:pimeloyl-ACP methyl ester carboxylesterase
MDLAPAVAAEVLLVHDRDDDIVPASHSQDVAPRFARATLRLTSGLGHSGPLRDPATVSAVLEFLGDASRRRRSDASC